MRRVPTQLLESALALALGVAALVAVLSTARKPAGVVFAGVIAAYTLGRQLLFPLRDLPRKTSCGRTLIISSPPRFCWPKRSPLFSPDTHEEARMAIATHDAGRQL